MKKKNDCYRQRNFLFLMVIGMLAHSGFIAGARCEEKDEEAKNSYLKEMKTRYEELMKSHEEMPAEAYRWVKQDIKNISTWDYRIMNAPIDSDTATAAKLNELGAERWEVVAVIPVEGKLKFLLKRSRKSYLKSLPVKDLLKMMHGEEKE